MRITAQTTLDEHVDLNQRIWAKSQLLRWRRLRFAISTSLLNGFFAYFIVRTEPVASAICVAVVVFLVTMVIHKRWERGYLRRYLKEQCRGDGPFAFSVELTDSAIEVELDAIMMSFPWTVVEEIVGRPDSIEFWTNQGTLIVVRNQWFDSPEHHDEFLMSARERLPHTAALKTVANRRGI